jgi:hypothetical protein
MDDLLLNILFGKPGLGAQIEIRTAYRTAMMGAVFKRDSEAAHAAVHAMLLACRRAGIDPVTITAPNDMRV